MLYFKYGNLKKNKQNSIRYSKLVTVNTKQTYIFFGMYTSFTKKKCHKYYVKFAEILYNLCNFNKTNNQFDKEKIIFITCLHITQRLMTKIVLKDHTQWTICQHINFKKIINTTFIFNCLILSNNRFLFLQWKGDNSYQKRKWNIVQ